MFPAMTSYKEAYDAFRWDIPETFNFATDVVDRWADDPTRLALVWENAAGESRAYTYADMKELTDRFANVLAGQGITKGDRVVVMLPRIPEWQIAVVGALKLGAVPIPSIEMLTARDMEYRVENSGAKAVICRTAQVGKYAGVIDKLPVRIAVGGAPGWGDFDALIDEAPEAFTAPVVRADDPAIIYYTSGSTGHPKGVTHAARGLYTWRVSGIYWLALKDGDRIWCTADTGWSKAGTSVLFGPWSCGACTFMYDGPFDPVKRLELIAKHGINVFCAPSTELFRLVNEDLTRYDLSALERTVSAGETVNAVVAQRWKEATGVDVYESYGMTEILITTGNYPCDPPRLGSIGRAQPGCVMEIVDDNGVVQPDGVDGHIALLTPSPQLMLGYWKDPERTERAHVTGPDGRRWFITGDTGTRDADGYITYTGRSDDVINSAGYRIGPMEVENALLEHPAVQECAVIGTPDTERYEIVKAYVVLREGVEGTDALERELQEHAKAITAPYKYPRAIAFIDALPKTITGKIMRRALRDLERTSATA